MGKKEKLHRKKVLARNEKIKAEKKKLLKVDLKGQELNFEVVEDRVVENSFQFKPNPSESSKITSEFEAPQVEESSNTDELEKVSGDND